MGILGFRTNTTKSMIEHEKELSLKFKRAEEDVQKSIKVEKEEFEELKNWLERELVEIEHFKQLLDKMKQYFDVLTSIYSERQDWIAHLQEEYGKGLGMDKQFIKKCFDKIKELDDKFNKLFSYMKNNLEKLFVVGSHKLYHDDRTRPLLENISDEARSIDKDMNFLVYATSKGEELMKKIYDDVWKPVTVRGFR